MTTNPEPVVTEVNVPLRAVAGNSELDLRVIPETVRPGALDQPVRWAHVSELRDPAPYLLGAELLLTAGVNLPSGPHEVDAYVRRLRDSGITALGFGVTPSLHERLPDSLRRACARHGLPLLVAQPKTPFLAISRAVAVAIAEANQREQRRVTEAREALTRAAGDGLGELAGTLADRLDGWIALVGADGELAVERGAPTPLPAEVRDLLATLRGGSGIRTATTELDGGVFVVAQPVYPQATASQLLVAGRTRRFDGTDRVILAVGAALLGLVATAGPDLARLGAAATGLLLGRAGQDRVLAELLVEGEYRVVAGVPYRRGPGATEAGYDWLRARLGTPLVRLGEDGGFTAIVGAGVGDARGAWLDQLRAHGWLAVAGGPVRADRLVAAAGELDALLARARALQRPVRAQTGLGLADVVAPEAAVGFAARVLAPLRELDRTRPDANLVRTLRAWLACHGGWDRTATALGVHRNSVRHRIRQVERALGVDLADPETRMELWFALRWED
ncbi:PucR family transcriptional regulator [Amycolatopsis nigrescens]|uniref:PucR family transcriptional regulator n=1 Tax=Amycolatopsis nigrescens TaxID=381445 RepID=UPI00037B8C88|nr:PucR family transcriptional regulator [Amycolatopsis nigrescens]